MEENNHDQGVILVVGFLTNALIDLFVTQ
jgi:hypothetical protein